MLPESTDPTFPGSKSPVDNLWPLLANRCETINESWRCFNLRLPEKHTQKTHDLREFRNYIETIKQNNTKTEYSLVHFFQTNIGRSNWVPNLPFQKPGWGFDRIKVPGFG